MKNMKFSVKIPVCGGKHRSFVWEHIVNKLYAMIADQSEVTKNRFSSLLSGIVILDTLTGDSFVCQNSCQMGTPILVISIS